MVQPTAFFARRRRYVDRLPLRQGGPTQLSPARPPRRPSRGAATMPKCRVNAGSASLVTRYLPTEIHDVAKAPTNGATIEANVAAV